MTRRPPGTFGQLRGGVRLAVEGVRGVARIVEGVHASVLRVRGPLGAADERPLGGITGFVYRSIHHTTHLVGSSLDAALAGAQQLLDDGPGTDAGAGREAVLSALNGVLGDHLERTGNPLAIHMQLLRRSAPGPRPLLLVHGLCMNERQWTREGHDHGQALATARGMSAMYLRYNSGRHISVNGAELAGLLESTLAAWPMPIEGLTIIGHSMGGLVARSAIHQAQAAGMRWPGLLRQLVFLGTPHHGAPLERGGNWLHRGLGISPYAAPFTRLSGLRSAGITDLRHGNLLASDWAEGRFVQRDARAVVPLPRGVACFAVAGTLTRSRPASRARDLDTRSDGLVSVASALGRHRVLARQLQLPLSQTFVAEGVGHLGLLSSHAVHDQLLSWLQPPPR
jgi:pimeloyl-ACP methyl ester carboxylesterase